MSSIFADCYQYAYFLLRRLCRTDKDKTFGEWRALFVFQLFELPGLVSPVLWISDELWPFKDNKIIAYIVGFLVIGFNAWYFSKKDRVLKFERRFKAYPTFRRVVFDFVTVVVFLILVSMPILLRQ